MPLIFTSNVYKYLKKEFKLWPCEPKRFAFAERKVEEDSCCGGEPLGRGAGSKSALFIIIIH